MWSAFFSYVYICVGNSEGKNIDYLKLVFFPELERNVNEKSFSIQLSNIQVKPIRWWVLHDAVATLSHFMCDKYKLLLYNNPYAETIQPSYSEGEHGVSKPKQTQ